MEIRDPYSIADKVDAWHEEADAQALPRPYLGISSIGDECERKIWLTYRWAYREHFPGRMLRLFRRGHREEETVVADLTAIGINVEHALDDQMELGQGCVMGHPDGVCDGVPGAEKTWHILEIKTANASSWTKLHKDGVQVVQPKHYAQIQCYMRLSGIDRALYVSICKDDDSMHTERIKLDVDFADRMIANGNAIAVEEHIPPRLSNDPTWYKCKYCPCYGMCHQQEPTQKINCRTCAHSTPQPDGSWTCARWDGAALPYEGQLVGCRSHVLHPDLVPFQLDVSKCTQWEAAYIIDGKTFINGEDHFPSDSLVLDVPLSTETITGLFKGRVVANRKYK